MSAQPSEEYYRENSDIIINNGVGDDMKNQCDELVKQLKNIAKEKREG